ncbi:MAG: anthranilate synthase component I family protein [Acidobacteriota bacterium]
MNSSSSPVPGAAAGSRYSFTERDLEPLSRRGNLAILCRTILADLMTPVGAYMRLARGHPHAFLLESVEGGLYLARYSFLGAGARRVFRIRRGRASLQENGGPEKALSGAPMEELKALRRRTHPVPLPGLPPFTGGLVGFFSYDFVRCLETVPDRAPDDLHVPDAVLAEYGTILAFDHRRNRLLLMAPVALDGGQERRKASYQQACRRVEEWIQILTQPMSLPLTPSVHRAAALEVAGRPSVESFRAGVVEARQKIAAGELFQMVISRRFSVPWNGSPLSVYRSLRSLNPSPYHFLLACDGDHLVGASPEMLVRVQGRRVTVRPIAGTRPRGENEEADRRLEQDLVADAKERAEHVMLVDLARNDIGRVACPGTVRVERLAQVERYSHVMHMVSSVVGDLREDADAVDALTACFPAGTLTGAPKIRAMQLIEEWEPFRRGPYGGAVVYLDHAGDLDSCINIRSVVLTGEQAHVQTGAGIVADSVPEREEQEIAHKARAMLTALAEAREIES